MPTDERETPTADKQPAPASQSGEQIVLFWIAAWVGTIVAGSWFGGMLVVHECGANGLGGVGLVPYFLIGLSAGALWAAVFAIPIHLTIAILTWVFWLNRFRLVAAAIAGAVTGIIATFFMAEGVVTGPLGAIGSAGVGCLYIVWQANKRPTPVASEKTVWQFTIRDLLVWMTVLAMLLSAGSCFFWVSERAAKQQKQNEKYSYPLR